MPRKKIQRNVVRARQLRRQMSLPEALLWRLLRRAPRGVVFRRQHPIGPYALDFYCSAAKLAIEVEGFAHDVGDRPERDEARTEWLNDQGIEVLRIAAKDVLSDPDAVADGLIQMCAKPLHHSPRLRRREERVKSVPTVPYTQLPELSDEERIERARAFREEMASRRSCRMFSDAPVPREVIEQAILAAGTAPSGANHQPWHFAVVSSPDLKHRIRVEAEKEEAAFYAGKAGQEWLEALAPLGTDDDKSYLDIAPWLIVVFGQRRGGLEPGDDKTNYYVTESVGIACGLLLAALHKAGLATLTHTPSPMGFLRAICGRPTNEKPLMLIVAGLPAADATVPEHALKKKPLDRISSWL